MTEQHTRHGQWQRGSRHPKAVAIAHSWPLSSQQIDFWLLALCSCVLTLLCHAMATLPQSPSGSGTSVAAQSTTTSTQSQSNFAFKLLTLGTPRPEVEDEDESSDLS